MRQDEERIQRYITMALWYVHPSNEGKTLQDVAIEFGYHRNYVGVIFTKMLRSIAEGQDGDMILKHSILQYTPRTLLAAVTKKSQEMKRRGNSRGGKSNRRMSKW